MTTPVAVVNRFETGPKTYEVVEAVAGGQLVEYRAGTPTQPGLSLVGVAAAGSFKCAGVATRAAQPNSAQAALQSFTDNTGFPAINVAVPSESVAVIKRGEVLLKYAAAAVYGDLLKVAAAGTVTPWVHGTDTDITQIVGRCQEQAGVALGDRGMTWISVV